MKLDFLNRSDPTKIGICFDPTMLLSLGFSAKAAGTIGSIATIAQPVLGIAGALAANASAKAEAREFERESKEQRITSQIRAERERRQNRLRQSRDRAAFAESGAMSGTAEGVLTQNATAYELDALMVEYQGEQNAQSAEFRAQQARRGASPLRVFSSAIRGFSQVDPLNLSPGGGAGGVS